MNKIIQICIFVTIACSLNTATAQDFYSINETLFAENHLDVVRKNSLAKLKEDQDSIEANYFLAMLAIKTAPDSDKAKIYAENMYVNNFQILYRKYAQEKDLMYGDQIMISDVKFLRIFYLLGLEYLIKQDYAKAVEWLNLAKFGYSDNPNLNFNFEIGTGYYAIKNYDKAMEYFEAAIKLKPDHSDALYNIACLYSLFANPDESIKRLDRAIQLDPKFKEIASKDSDFDNIRKTPQYKNLMLR